MQIIVLSLILLFSWQYGKLIIQSNYVYLLLTANVLLWSLILLRWQRGIFFLLLYLPFAGFVSIKLSASKLPLLFKDLFFVMPVYAAFFLSWQSHLVESIRIAPGISWSGIVLAFMVFAQMFNPHVSSFMVGAIGAKVWLLYMPLMYIAYAMIEDRDDLVNALKPMVVTSWIPCLFGIFLWISSMQTGYIPTMLKYYGTAAVIGDAPVSGGIQFFRIPSTFTYATQYVWYTIAMIIPSFMLMRLSPTPGWHRFSALTLGLVVLASFLSGGRAAFAFVPAMLMTIYWLEGGFARLGKPVLIVAGVFLAVFLIANMGPGFLLSLTGSLSMGYMKGSIIPNFLYALGRAPLGLGTGVSTNAARHAFETSGTDAILFSESQYTKAVLELGIPGLLVQLSLFVLILRHGYRIHCAMEDRSLIGCSSAILAFIMLVVVTGMKGAAIDIDPVNVYFWVFAGFLLKLGDLDATAQDSVLEETLEENEDIACDRRPCAAKWGPA